MGKGYVERCLWEYKENAAELEVLRMEQQELMSLHVQSYEAHGANGVSDPVSEVAHRRMTLEKKIVKLERRTKPVEKLQGDLCGNDMRISQMREILRLRYLAHDSHEDIQRRMAVSSATYWRRSRELLRMARRYFGEAA